MGDSVVLQRPCLVMAQNLVSEVLIDGLYKPLLLSGYACDWTLSSHSFIEVLGNRHGLHVIQ